MMEFISRAFVLGSAGWFLLIMLGMCTYVLISQMLDDNLQAFLGTPVLLFGAAIGQQVFRELGIPLNSDKTVSMGIGMMMGLVASSIVMVLFLWAVNASRSR